MTRLEERVLEYLRHPSTKGIQREEEIAQAVDMGDVLDVLAALHLLQSRGLVIHCFTRGAMCNRTDDTLRAIGWMLSMKAEASSFPSAPA